MFFFLLFLLPLAFFFLRISMLKLSKLPPGPNIYQFLRIITKYGKEPHVAFNKLANVYGPLISIRLGGQLLIVASSPATAKEILKTHDRVFAGRYMPATYYEVPLITKSSITMSRECNDTWKFLRGIGQKHFFSSRAIDSKAKIRMDKVADMMRYLVDKQGVEVRLDDVICATIINILTNNLVSKDLLDLREENVEKLKDLLDEIVETIASPGLSDLFPVLKYVDFWSKQSGMILHRKIMLAWKDIFRERRLMRCANSDTTRGDFLDVALDNAFTDDQIGNFFMELLIGGTDSTNITCIWTMVELIKNKEIFNKVRGEIDQAFESGVIDEPRLTASKYLQACIKETLRLHITGPFLAPHRATDECKVGNYIIPRDSLILINAWAIQIDPNNWKDPLLFNPDRFMDSKIDFRGANFDFIPFSAGQRMCPGSNMGIRNIQMVVAYLVHYFEWHLPNGADSSTLDTKDIFAFILKREKPLYLIPKLREKVCIQDCF